MRWPLGHIPRTKDNAMSVLCPAQVTSRANTQLGIIEQIVSMRDVPSTARMELIAIQIDAWLTNTAGSTERITAHREALRVAIRPGNAHLR
jgi:hypothetical protein